MTTKKPQNNQPALPSESARDLAKKNIEEIKSAQEQFLMALSSAQNAFVHSTGMGNQHAADDLNAKTFNFLKSNLDSGYEFAKKMVDATDITEAVELQNDYIRQQMEAYTEQAQALSDAMIHHNDED